MSYDPLTFELFNSMFTFLPIFTYALFPEKREVSESWENPKEYMSYSNLKGEKNLSWVSFIKSSLLSIWHALIAFILM